MKHLPLLPLLFFVLASRLSIAQSTGNNSLRALEWELLAQRADGYDDTTSAWYHIDSLKYGFNSNGITDTTFYLVYYNGNWNNSSATFNTYNNSDALTYELNLTWDTVGNQWVNFSDVTYTLDAHNNSLSSTVRVWVSSLNAWQNSSQYLYTYNAQNSELSDVEQHWDTINNVWVNSIQNIYTYDDNNYLLTYVYQNWSGSAWVNYLQRIYTNDEHCDVLTDLYQVGNDTGWLNRELFTYTYNSSNLETQYIEQSWDSSAVQWANVIKYNYAYDGNGNDTLENGYEWSPLDTGWVNDFQNTYTFVDSNKISTLVAQVWNGTAWSNGFKYIYTYDANLNETEFQVSLWNTPDSAWAPSAKATFTYDTYNNRIYELYQLYNNTGQQYINDYQYFYYYIQLNVTAINETSNQLNTVLYPNPSDGNNITLITNMEQNAPVRIGLYDAQGRLLNTAMYNFINGSNTTHLSYPNISAGNYYIQVLEYATGKSSVIKFVKSGP